jgi:hypothetical protein
MRRIIVDYKKLTPEILSLLVSKYPDGYDDEHVITFRNAKNELIEAVEVKTDDTVYLVKVSARLEVSMANFDEDDYADDDFNEPISELPEKAVLDSDLDPEISDDDDDIDSDDNAKMSDRDLDEEDEENDEDKDEEDEDEEDEDDD